MESAVDRESKSIQGDTLRSQQLSETNNNIPVLAISVHMSGSSLPNSLTGFIDRVGETEWSIQIINQTAPEPIQGMLDKLFGGLAIETTEVDLPEADDDIVVLVHDGEVVASSPLSTLRDTLLMVNSDLYKTGTTEIQDIDPPDIITALICSSQYLRKIGCRVTRVTNWHLRSERGETTGIRFYR